MAFYMRTMLCLSLLISTAKSANADTSSLLSGGSHMKPGGRLPDYSFAGYRRGEAPIPNPDVVADVTDFGATANDDTDDTDAFQKALAEAPRGAIRIPPGRFIITDFLIIDRPGVVLRGTGPKRTTLYCPKPLHEIKPDMDATTGGRPTSSYSWSGGIVRFVGSYQNKRLAAITQHAKRGDTRITVDNAAPFKVGQDVMIRLSGAPAHAVAKHLYAGDHGDVAMLSKDLYTGDQGDITKLSKILRVSVVCKVVAIDGDTLQLDRRLRFDCKPEWKATAHRFEPTVTDSGIEGVAFEYPPTPYRGHFTEKGFNAIAFGRVAHCWARDLRIVNPDSGIFVAGKFCTIDGVVIESKRQPSHNAIGHHGIYFAGDDNLYRGFDYRCRFIHDISVAHCAGNVIMSGRGVDLCLDHHKIAPHANLFTNIDLGVGSRPWASGGGKQLGKHAGAWNTYWNLRSQRPIGYPPPHFACRMINVVGVHTKQPSVTEPDGKWFEAIPPHRLRPANLYEAQLNRRLRLMKQLNR